MSTQALPANPRRTRPRTRLLLASGAALALLVAMAFSTKVVRIGSGIDASPGAFSAAAYGPAQFPKVQAAVESRAVDAATLAAAIAKDPAAAAKQYAIDAGTGPDYSVKFTGVVGKGDFGNYDVKIDGLPDPPTVRVQTGPAILGTDLRDATGTISFGQFTNQIEYQNAGSAINKEMKKQVLSPLDTANLSGKTISVVGAFQLSDPKTWLVTPVRLSVQ